MSESTFLMTISIKSPELEELWEGSLLAVGGDDEIDHCQVVPVITEQTSIDFVWGLIDATEVRGIMIALDQPNTRLLTGIIFNHSQFRPARKELESER